MNRTAKSLARKVANGTVTLKAAPAEMRAFKEAAGLLQWFGVKGGGVLNHASGERVKSWAALAQLLLDEAEGSYGAEAESRMAEVASAGEANPSPYPTRGLIPELDAILDRRAAEEATEPEAAPEVSYFYATRTPTVRLSDMTVVDAIITEGIMGVTEGLCESGASLECSLEDPSMGILRTLPESMLPGQERTILLQCLPCYEASAEAYVRKLHHAS